MSFLQFLTAAVFAYSGLYASALTLTLAVPPSIPALPPSSTAYLTSYNLTLRTPITRSNTFRFEDFPPRIKPSLSKSYLLEIACRDYEFASYGVDVNEAGNAEIYRVSRGGIEHGERIHVGEGAVEVKVLRGKEYYETRAGFNPMSLLRNPMILIGVVGFAFVVGMPYVLENMDPETRKEFEEQQKKGVLGTGAQGPNPFQNFDMAAWMAGSTSASPAAASTGSDQATIKEGSTTRRRG